MKASQPIQNREPICEYEGELVSADEAEERRSRRLGHWRKILVALVGHPVRGYVHDSYCSIDSTNSVGFGRLINHCRCTNRNLQRNVLCDANGEIRIVFFASRFISSGEELRFQSKPIIVPKNRQSNIGIYV